MPDQNDAAAFRVTTRAASADLTSLDAFSTISEADLRGVLSYGLPSPAIGCRIPGVDLLHRHDYVDELLKRTLGQPLNVTAGSFVHLRFALLTPAALQIATGHGNVRAKRNDELVHVRTTQDLLRRYVGCVFYVDRELLSPSVKISSDPWQIQVDVEFINSRNFKERGRNSEFGAGLILYGVLPPHAVSSLICADERSRVRVAEIVSQSGLAIPVQVDARCYFSQGLRPADPAGDR